MFIKYYTNREELNNLIIIKILENKNNKKKFYTINVRRKRKVDYYVNFKRKDKGKRFR